MTVVVGHPTGNPNSHHAALAYFERGWLERFCVAWMPTPRQLRALRHLQIPARWVSRLERRCFPPLLPAPRSEGPFRELWRLARRALRPVGDERVAYEANDWLARRMADECRRPAVTAVHAYEDCALLAFEEARRLDRAKIYDMPIGFHLAWASLRERLAMEFRDWLSDRIDLASWERPPQKIRELELADLVLAPSTFVRRTLAPYVDKPVALTPYGVDGEQWRPPDLPPEGEVVRFLYAGQLSIRKGTPLLLEAWRKAALTNARLDLVGPWLLSQEKLRALPPGVHVHPPCSAPRLRDFYQGSDVFVFPSYFEGFGLVLLEALACGLFVIASDATAGPDLLDPSCGAVHGSGDCEALVDLLRRSASQPGLIRLRRAACRVRAEAFPWSSYRAAVAEAVSSFAGAA
jgi:alpha-maltose-1-phosphate synthase